MKIFLVAAAMSFLFLGAILLLEDLCDSDYFLENNFKDVDPITPKIKKQFQL